MLLQNYPFLPSPFIYKKEITLKNGRTIHIRSIHAEDEPALRSFFKTLSEESIFLRFGSHRINMGHEHLARFCQLDYDRDIAIVAVVPGEREIIIGDARINRLSDLESAEIAFAIADQWQGMGIGSMLMDFCMTVAKQLELKTLLMEVMRSNVKMKRLGFKFGFQQLPRSGEHDIDVLCLEIGSENHLFVSFGKEHVLNYPSIDSLTTFFNKKTRGGNEMLINISDLTDGMGKLFNRKFIESSQHVSYGKGVILFRKGEVPRYFYTLIQGEIRLTVESNERSVYTVHLPGDIFGWSSLVAGTTYSATAVCTKFSELLRFDCDQLVDLLDKHPVSGIHFYKKLSMMLGRRLLALYPLIKETEIPGYFAKETGSQVAIQ